MKQKSDSRVLVVAIIVALICSSLSFVGGQFFQLKFNKCKNPENYTNNSNSVSTVEEKEPVTLKELETIYENAYKKMYDGILTSEGDSYKINEQEATPYFTKRGIDYLKETDSDFIEVSSIFSSTDASVRPLTILTYSNDTVLVSGIIKDHKILKNGKVEVGEGADDEEYPHYMVFKLENNTWKIDHFA